MKKFKFLKAFFSPFKRPKIYFYIGKMRYGTPIFYPRKWVDDKDKPGYKKAVPKKIGFDFVDLGWKTKWSGGDYRFEWNPIWSFVFFKWQVAILFIPIECAHYWESWLFYELSTNKSKNIKERIKDCKTEFPNTWIQYNDGSKKSICYYDVILKRKYINL